jgi:O-antigen/teichoic acid export membrane protein
LSTFAFIILTPFLLSSLGLERYGVLLLVLGFLIYTNLAELGIGGAVTREIAACDNDRRGRIFGNAMILSAAFACVGGLFFSLLALPTVAGFFVKDLRTIADLEETKGALFALGALSILGGVPRGVLLGLSHFVQLNFVGVFSAVGSLVAPALYAGIFGIDLLGLIASVALAHFLTLMLSLALCMFVGERPEFQYDRSIARTLVSYGGWSTASAVLHRLTNSLDRFAISALVGPAAVPLFAIPDGALNRAQLISNALLSAAFPRLARAPYDKALIETCYRSVLSLTPLFVIGIAVLQPLLSFWLDADFAELAHRPAVLLAVAVWADMVGKVPWTLLGARSQMSVEAKISSIIVIPNIILIIGLIKFFGVTGAAIAAVIRAFYFMISRLIITKSDKKLKLTSLLNSMFLLTMCALSSFEQNVPSSFVIPAKLVIISLIIYFNFKSGAIASWSIFANGRS